MENDEKMIPEVKQPEACLLGQPTAAGKCAGSNSQEIRIPIYFPSQKS